MGRIFAEKEGLKPGMKEWGDCSEIFFCELWSYD